MGKTLSRWLPAIALSISLVSLSGCTGVETEPQGEPPVEETPSEEYLKGERAIE